LAGALGAPPAAAADGVGAPGAGRLAAAVAVKLETLQPPAHAFVQAAPAAAPESGGRPFFKSPAGVVAIVLMAVGTGYVVYSASHDRKPVKSPIR
jgi:hypothetical protein